MAGFPIPGKNKKGEPAKRPDLKHIPLDKVQVMQQLQKSYGNISRTADCLGCARQSIQRMIDNDPEVKECHKQSRQRFVDDLEQNTWQDALETRDTAMRIFLLKTQARDRGYEQDDNKNYAQDISKAAFEYVMNQSKNPAE